MNKLIKVKNSSTMALDPNTWAVMNINKKEIEAAKARKEKRIQESKRLDQIESDVSEIKELLLKIVGNNNGN